MLAFAERTENCLGCFTGFPLLYLTIKLNKMIRFTFLMLLVIVALQACDNEPLIIVEEDPIEVTDTTETSTIDTIDTQDTLDLETSFCIPPFGVDTSTVLFFTELDGVPYQPMANFVCTIPNFFLDIDQIWVNGSIPPALKVVTLMMPVDISPGEYPIQLNSPYDARYVPSMDNNFSVDNGMLYISKHDTVNHIIEGGFEFNATNLASPVLPSVSFTNGCFWVQYE